MNNKDHFQVNAVNSLWDPQWINILDVFSAIDTVRLEDKIK